MRAFVVTLLSICSVGLVARADDYRNQSLANLKRETKVHIFLEKGVPYSKIDDMPGLYLQYLVDPGQTKSFLFRGGTQTVSRVAANKLSDSELQIRAALQLGYYPYPTSADFPQAGETWQNGAAPLKIDYSKPYCMVGQVSELGPKAPLSFATHIEDPFPTVTVEAVEFTHSTKGFNASIILHNEQKDIAWDANCTIPAIHNDFTVGEFEDAFGGWILMKGAEFSSQGTPSINIASLQGLKVQVLKSVVPPRDSLNVATLQNGRILGAFEKQDDSKPLCIMQKYKYGPLHSTVKGNGRVGVVDDTLSGNMGDTIPDSPMYVGLRVMRNNGSSILAMVNKTHSNFSLWCTMNDGASIPTIGDLNAVTGTYIQFSK